MSIWVINTGVQQQPDARHISIGWEHLPDLTQTSSQHELKALLRTHMPDDTPERINRYTQELWDFIDRIEFEDMVVIAGAAEDTVALVRITGPYRFEPGDTPHTRAAEWLDASLALASLPRDNPLLHLRTGMYAIEEPSFERELHRRYSSHSSGRREKVGKILFAIMLTVNLIALLMANLH